ncbi:hypothetical protein F5879DRAFT_975562 [Lentinula edodes]|nr:hypothetical protein F5879DRAFT_975562 [Lentinula edodes]
MKMILVFAIVSALFTTLLGSCHASPIIIEDSTAHLGLKRGEPSTRPSGNEPAPYSEVEPPSLLVCYFALDGNVSLISVSSFLCTSLTKITPLPSSPSID